MTDDARPKGRQTIGLFLTKSEETEATLEYLAAEAPEVRVEDHHTYYRVDAEGTIRIPLKEVAEYLGRPLSIGTWLVSMSTYYGRAEADDDAFVLTSALPQLEGLSQVPVESIP